MKAQCSAWQGLCFAATFIEKDGGMTTVRDVVMKVLSGMLPYLLLILWGFPASLQAANTVAPKKPSAPPAASLAAPTLPGLAEVIPRLAKLKQNLTDLQAQLNELQQTDTFAKQLQLAVGRAKSLSDELFTGHAEWNFDRLLNTRSQLTAQQDDLTALLDAISGRLQKLDFLRQHWQGQQQFWTKWHQTLPADLVATQREAFQTADGIIKTMQQQIVTVGKPLVALQDKVAKLQGQNQTLLTTIDTFMQTLRGETFKKTARSLANPNFYREFDRSLLESAKQGLAGALDIGWDFFKSQGWLVGIQMLAITFLGLFLLLKSRKGTVTKEWRFIIQHPFATAIFVSVLACGPFYVAPPALWRWLLALLAAFSAATLFSGLIEDQLKKSMTYVLAGVFVVTFWLQIVALPLPLYRLYLVLLSLLGIPFLLVLAGRYRRTPARETDAFLVVLHLGTAVLVCSIIAQWSGFSTLSSRMVDSSIKTAFLGLFAWMTMHLNRGIIHYLLKFPFLRQRLFVIRFGEELQAHLLNVLRIAIFVYAALYLVVIWGIFPDTGQAWHSFLQLKFEVLENKLSMKLLLMAIVALYISIQGSWFLRSLLDTEFFPQRRIDRGVHDSIMKLLHYGVITCGFLLAISLTGFELKNLVVVAGALGIGIGFGLQHIVNNFVSGLILLFERPIKVGDAIMIDSQWCTVCRIGLRATTVETLDQSEIIVPNSDLISQKVTNWTLSSERSRIVIRVGVAYGSDVRQVLDLLTTCADRHTKVLKEPPPSPLLVEFGENALLFELRAYVAKVSERLQTRSDLLMDIEQTLCRAGVEIPLPQRVLHLHQKQAEGHP